ncbi:Lipoprotein releasing system, transmembrane protein, LolC/E family [uncultured delta proteobacterium]|uniref:Lipoprotein releasing system, transmembrane protein, LolC/E family n=1 Tax=uncultured delta proteobacterium TaxID=34034 RepID=A0A212JW91_9DELT|nr:Lipoprotein releasing system, transmembrane protein, LolC/E family [uncultured delta proteobacterium]
MRFELFVALRYLLGRRTQAFISVISLISTTGVAIGVAALIIVTGVINGFTTDLRDKIVGVNAHAMVLSATNIMPQQTGSDQFEYGTDSLESIMNRVRAVPEVTGVMPFIYSELMISGPRGIKGLILRGVDPATAKNVLHGIVTRITKGDFADIAPETGLPGIIIGKELAARIGATVGSRVNLLAPTAQKGTAGFTPRVKSVKVAAIFSTGMYEYDSSLGVVSLELARDLLGRPEGDWVTGLELTVTDVYKADRIAEQVGMDLGPPYYVRNWMEMNASLFAALKLEKIGMAIMVTLIILVASFSIVTALVMLVMEKTRDIAILMSMGATRQAVRRIFMYQGLVIGVVGTAAGFILGLSICWLLKKYQFIKLPPGVYSLDYLPILLQWSDLALVAAGSVLMCYLATLYPANRAASLEPVEALRYE